MVKDKAMYSPLSKPGSRLVLLWLLCHVAVATAESVGEQIYFQGLADRKAALSRNHSLSAELFACANCHGDRGEGGREGGVLAPAIHWSALSKDFIVNSERKRRRPAYTRQGLFDVVRSGVDSSGQTLSPLMPRYNYSDAELESLLAMLKMLPRRQTLGVDNNRIDIAVALADDKDRPALTAMVKAYFEQVNEQGGIFQRQLNLIDSDDLEFSAGCCLAILGLSLEALPKWAEDSVRVSVFFSDKASDDGYFALYSNARQRRTIFLNYARKRSLHSPYWLQQKLHRLGRRGERQTVRVEDNRSGPQYWSVEPPGPTLTTARGKAGFMVIRQRAGTSNPALARQLGLLSAAKFLVHGLQASGRGLDVSELTKQLVVTYDFHSHFGPPLSFGPNRKIGAPGAVLGRMDSGDKGKGIIQRQWISADSRE